MGFCSQTKALSSVRQDMSVFSFSFFPLISNMKTGLCQNHTKNAKRNKIQKKEKPCVRLVPEKWWWKQILASRWWKGMSTPSSLTELPFRSPDSSSFAKASLTRKKNNDRRSDSSYYDQKQDRAKRGNRKWRLQTPRLRHHR